MCTHVSHDLGTCRNVKEENKGATVLKFKVVTGINCYILTIQATFNNFLELIHPLCEATKTIQY